jgi:hypothetical protein
MSLREIENFVFPKMEQTEHSGKCKQLLEIGIPKLPFT